MRQSRSVRRLMLLLLASLLIGAAPPARAPQRIVSLNLCADQYLLALADPGQITALTRFARDPEMSAAAARAARLPMTKGSAEDVLALRPDLLIAAPGRTAGVLKHFDSRRRPATLDLSPADSYAAVIEQVRQVAAAVGHPERGEALIARMDARLARVSRAVGRGRVAAYYQRRGFLTGTGTLIDDLMTRLGLVNLATRLGKPPLAQVSLEEMALARPDLLIVETATDRVVDQGTEMLHHPVLGRIRRIRLRQAWTVCGGPAYVLATESLARQLGSQAP